MKKICIVTSGHPPFDERIFWKFALSFNENGYNTSIVCSTMEISSEEKGIILKGFNGENLTKREKINKLKALLAAEAPDLIICCEPVTIIAASRYRSSEKRSCRIISDITEWYPENVALKFHGLKRILTWIYLWLFNVYSVNKADALIIGEPSKKKRYDRIAPFRKKELISYYPVLKYFRYVPKPVSDELVLGYAGLISFDRGIKTLLKAASEIARQYPFLEVIVKLAGKFADPAEEKEFSELAKKTPGVSVRLAGFTSYDKISDLLKDMNLCFDLRRRNFIYNNSLPIKIFEYMAAGKPFIYSDINPIKKEINYTYCGQLVDPNNINEICEAVGRYIKDRELLMIHARNGRKIVEDEKNWEKESLKLIKFIAQI